MKKEWQFFVVICMVSIAMFLNAQEVKNGAGKNHPQKVSANDTKPILSYATFKDRFTLAALQNRVPFSLADSLIKKGPMGANMRIFFTNQTDMFLYMSASLEIEQLIITISGPKIDGKFADIGYASAVIWALENFDQVAQSTSFLKKILALPSGAKFTSSSGFRYSCPQATENSTGFVAVSTRE